MSDVPQHDRRGHRDREEAPPRIGDDAPPPVGDDAAPPVGDAATAFAPRRYAFSLLAIAVLAVWKVYEAITADTMRAAIPPSLYTMGLAGFAVSILGPKPLQAVMFLVGAALCIGAIALELR